MTHTRPEKSGLSPFASHCWMSKRNKRYIILDFHDAITVTCIIYTSSSLKCVQSAASTKADMQKHHQQRTTPPPPESSVVLQAFKLQAAAFHLLCSLHLVKWCTLQLKIVEMVRNATQLQQLKVFEADVVPVMFLLVNVFSAAEEFQPITQVIQTLVK